MLGDLKHTLSTKFRKILREGTPQSIKETGRKGRSYLKKLQIQIFQKETWGVHNPHLSVHKTSSKDLGKAPNRTSIDLMDKAATCMKPDQNPSQNLPEPLSPPSQQQSRVSIVRRNSTQDQERPYPRIKEPLGNAFE
ncbi:unnamed protein product [Calypogeia fissa]